MHPFKILLTSSAALLLVACAGTEQTPPEQAPVVESGTGNSTGSDVTTVSVVPGGGKSAPNPLDDPNGLLTQRIVYFDYDSSEVRDTDLSVIEAHARYLLNTPSAAILLEGHTDERGSREYNVALGERRALSVTQIMQLLGVPASQMRTVSYGEERPEIQSNDENAWQQNRRVELVY